MKARGDDRIKSATFLVTMTDFAEAGELSVFVDEEQLRALEERMEKQGYLEGSDMAQTFNMLRANDLIWSFVVNNYLMGKEPFQFDLLYWNSDATRMPAQMHSFYLRNMYQKNLLAQPAGSSWRARRSTWARWTCPPISSPPAKTISRPGRAPIAAPSSCTARTASCWPRPGISPAWSTRRRHGQIQPLDQRVPAADAGGLVRGRHRDGWILVAGLAPLGQRPGARAGAPPAPPAATPCRRSRTRRAATCW